MFIIHQDYDRADLLNFVGSKQAQSGIIWGKKEPGCVIVTSGGKGGESVGYEDVINPDGTILYIGQGAKGNQDSGLYANSLLYNKERSVLFFSTTEPTSKQVKARGNRRKRYKFEGIYEVVECNVFMPAFGPRINDQLLSFLLIPAKNIFNIPSTQLTKEEEVEVKETSLKELRKKIAINNDVPNKGFSNIHEYFIRSVALIKYARKRAEGYCELCKDPAPFIDTNDLPFLEVHHISRLSDDGPDHPNNVAAICPNCHREAHYGKNKDEIKDALYRIIIAKEDEYD